MGAAAAMAHDLRLDETVVCHHFPLIYSNMRLITISASNKPLKTLFQANALITTAVHWEEKLTSNAIFQSHSQALESDGLWFSALLAEHQILACIIRLEEQNSGMDEV